MAGRRSIAALKSVRVSVYRGSPGRCSVPSSRVDSTSIVVMGGVSAAARAVASPRWAIPWRRAHGPMGLWKDAELAGARHRYDTRTAAAELAHDVGEVSVHGVRAEDELRADL